MNQIHARYYEVAPAEEVTIEVDSDTAVLGVRAGLDGATLPKVGEPPPHTFEFPATKPIGEIHVVVLGITFVSDEPPDAVAHVRVGPFHAYDVHRADLANDYSEDVIQFEVKAGGGA